MLPGYQRRAFLPVGFQPCRAAFLALALLWALAWDVLVPTTLPVALSTIFLPLATTGIYFLSFFLWPGRDLYGFFTRLLWGIYFSLMGVPGRKSPPVSVLE